MTREYQFIFVPASDEMVDDEYEMKTPDFQNTNFSIQVCPYAGGYGVNENHLDANGDLKSMTDHGTYRTLNLAKTKAITLYEKKI